MERPSERRALGCSPFVLPSGDRADCLNLHSAPSELATLISSRQAALEIIRAERPWLGDQLPGGVHLLPDVPQQYPAHSTIPQVVDHTFTMRLLPIGYCLQTGIHFTHRLVAEIE